LRAEPRFPEMPGTVIFDIGALGDGLIEQLHEPAQRG
jgi:hypothetical protein